MRRPRRQNHEPRAKGPAPRAAAWQSRAETRSRTARAHRKGDDWGEVHKSVLPNGLRVLTAIPPGSTRP